MKNKEMLIRLKIEIQNILNQLNSLKSKKQEEIREINKVKKEFICLDKILTSDLPVNRETAPVFEAISASGDFVSHQLSDLLERSTLDKQIFYTAASTASATVLTIANTASLDIHVPLGIKQEVLELTSGDREKTKQEISNFLKIVSPYLVDIYLNANENLDIVSAEPERGAVGLMREVVNQALSILANDDEIKNQAWLVPDSSSRSGITMAHRLKYIAEIKSLDSKSRELIEENAELFKATVKNLNALFHKRKQLDKEEAKLFFYQAETLLKILSNSIKL